MNYLTKNPEAFQKRSEDRENQYSPLCIRSPSQFNRNGLDFIQGPSPHLKAIFRESHQLKMTDLMMECNSGCGASPLVASCINGLQNDEIYPQKEQKREVCACSVTKVTL